MIGTDLIAQEEPRRGAREGYEHAVRRTFARDADGLAKSFLRKDLANLFLISSKILWITESQGLAY